MINRLAIVGVGLIGGSLALALKQAGAVGHVAGCGRNQKNLDKAVQLGVIDSYEESISDAVKGADIVVLAVPLGAMQSVFVQIKDVIGDATVITDVGSAKQSVVDIASANLGPRIGQFVPGHPIAGTEKSGVEAGFASLYQNRRVILTPLDSTDPAAIARIDAMWRQCGASVEYLGVGHHDKVLAATSHLPHMLAYALVNYLSRLNDHEEIFNYAAGGFRDFTRIASSDPVMWRDVCISNGDALLTLIEGYKNELDQVSAAIRDADHEHLLQLFGKAKSERDSLIGL
ncbi:MAG: prephenate dehydrogenase/arogenate dehydrogenase family protein [Gammaproteobacteria bacterium]|jgi:prephenate dehydrogenase|nr:prephenate dehydrogenase/arogenate dehydrogenase family protein [Gammaproteobacteria bacterium]